MLIYADKNGQAAFRYMRLLTLGRFELALTWPTRDPSVPTMADRPSEEEMLRGLN